MKRSTLHNMTYDSYDDMSTCWLECELSDWMPPYYKAINYSHTFVIQVTQIPNSIKKKLKFWPPVLLRDMIMKENMNYFFKTVWSVMQLFSVVMMHSNKFFKHYTCIISDHGHSSLV